MSPSTPISNLGGDSASEIHEPPKNARPDASQSKYPEGITSTSPGLRVPELPWDTKPHQFQPRSGLRSLPRGSQALCRVYSCHPLLRDRAMRSTAVAQPTTDHRPPRHRDSNNPKGITSPSPGLRVPELPWGHQTASNPTPKRVAIRPEKKPT